MLSVGTRLLSMQVVQSYQTYRSKSSTPTAIVLCSTKNIIISIATAAVDMTIHLLIMMADREPAITSTHCLTASTCKMVNNKWSALIKWFSALFLTAIHTHCWQSRHATWVDLGFSVWPGDTLTYDSRSRESNQTPRLMGWATATSVKCSWQPEAQRRRWSRSLKGGNLFWMWVTSTTLRRNEQLPQYYTPKLGGWM